MDMEIISDPSRGLKWVIDNQEMFTIDDPQPIESIRFCTLDGPGYYESAPTVFYLDNFGIDKGTLLSAETIPVDDYPGTIFFNGESITVSGFKNQIKQIDVLNIKGQLLKSIIPEDHYGNDISIPVPSKDNVIILLIYDSRNRMYTRKLVNWGLRKP